ncbi:hypothetical protein L195_g061497, partial [Trifolium pratense]
ERRGLTAVVREDVSCSIDGAGRRKEGWVEEEGRMEGTHVLVQENEQREVISRGDVVKEGAGCDYSENKVQKSEGAAILDCKQRKEIVVLDEYNNDVGGVTGSDLKR